MPVTSNINELRQKYNTLRRKLPLVLGKEAVNFFKDNFRKGGWEGDNGNEQWQNRKPDIDGRARSRRTLIKSGNLRRSIRIATTTYNSVTIATNLPYAKIHNEGGTIVQKPTWRQRMFFSHRSNQAEESRNRSAANAWAAMSTAKKLTIPIPKRQFMGNSKALDERIEKRIIAHLKQLFT